LSLLLLAAGCFCRSSRTESWSIPVTDSIASDHVTYTNGILTIDGVEVPLPDGEVLFIEYRVVNGRSSTIVNVDGKSVHDGSLKR
jgi:hypothetical protein